MPITRCYKTSGIIAGPPAHAQIQMKIFARPRFITVLSKDCKSSETKSQDHQPFLLDKRPLNAAQAPLPSGGLPYADTALPSPVPPNHFEPGLEHSYQDPDVPFHDLETLASP